MKATAPMCRLALSALAAPGLWVCRVCAITRRKMRSTMLAGEGYKVVVPTVAAASAGKAMGKDAALKILGKRFAHEGLGGVP